MELFHLTAGFSSVDQKDAAVCEAVNERDRDYLSFGLFILP